MAVQPTYYSKKFILTVALPIVTFWTLLFLFGYPLPTGDDIFFTGAAINLAKGGEFTNPYLEAWNSVFSSGKFYFQPPFHSFTLAGWLKLTGISTTSLRLFQYLCYNTFSLSSALLFRFFGFPRLTAFCTTILFAVWHCNPNPSYSTGFRHDALGMAYLALGLWLLTRDNWWRYFLGFTFLGSAVFTSPIIAAYTACFGAAILIINFIYLKNVKNVDGKYFINRGLALLAATGLVITLLLLCINFELKAFLSDFMLHASMRRTPAVQAIPIFLKLITQYYSLILYLPSYILFLSLAVVVFIKRYSIPKELKILFIALTTGIIINIFLYTAAIGFTFFFSWLGIVAIISTLWWQPKIRLATSVVAIIIFLSSQSLNILSLAEREYLPPSHYQKIKATVMANPNRKYAVDPVAARFVFDYKLPKNSIDWGYIRPAPAAAALSVEDKQPDVTWIANRAAVGSFIPEMRIDYPKVEFLGRTFNSLPKRPFELILIP